MLLYSLLEDNFNELKFNITGGRIMFVGREEELQQLSDAFSVDQSAILVYGKRRVGKTTLIKQALLSQKKDHLYYECIKGTVQDNIDAFTRMLLDNHVLQFSTSFSAFRDVFAYLNTLPHKFIIVIDEYPYLKSLTSGEIVDSEFQFVIDNHLSNINLVLSGSHIGMMKEMLEEGNALYGRFGTIIRLRELSYRTAALFYSPKSAYDKVALYSVFGGSPFVLSQLKSSESLQQNIIRTILSENNPVHLYAANLLLSDYSNSVNTERILAVLGNGKKRYTELENKLGTNKTGNLSKQLKALTDLEIVRRSAPINKLDDAKKTGFEINDNLLRFYYTFVYRNSSALQMLGPRAFYTQYIAPKITEFISHRFEEICRDYFSHLVKTGQLPEVKNIGGYYYDDPATKTNGEFDVALALADSYALFEAKYYQSPMKLGEIHEEIEQIRAIKDLHVSKIGFIAANGFVEKEAGFEYHTADDLYA